MNAVVDFRAGIVTVVEKGVSRITQYPCINREELLITQAVSLCASGFFVSFHHPVDRLEEKIKRIRSQFLDGQLATSFKGMNLRQSTSPVGR